MITNYLSSVFNLLVFIGIILSLSTFIILRVQYKKGSVYNKRFFVRYFGLIGLASVIVIWCYVYPPTRIFSNADHHVIEHLGFGFRQQLPLVNQQNSQSTIWDNKHGQLLLRVQDTDRFVLHAQNYYSPIFTQTEAQVYTLANPIVNQAIQQQLTIQWDSVAINVQFPTQKDSLAWFTTTYLGQRFGPFSIPVTMPLRNGYSLGGLVSKSQADAPGMAQVVALLEDVMLVRKFYETGKSTAVRDTLLLFPSQLFIASEPTITIDGQPVNINNGYQVDIPLASIQSFYVGLWGLQNKIYKAQIKNRETGDAEFLVTFPDKKYLKKLENDKESLFLTSSSDEIARSEQLGGFYYPQFEKNDNLNHFSSNLTYRTGNSREKLLFRVINFDQNDLSNNNINQFEAGDTLKVQTRGMVQGRSHTQWLFRIKDLKDSNPLQFWHLVLLIGLLVFCIFVSIYLTPYKLQSKTEYIIYLLLLALITLRSILLWRVSTFLPTEQISSKVFDAMSQLGWSSYKITVLFILGFFGLVWLWKLQGAKVSQWIYTKTEKSFRYFSPNLLTWFGCYILAFGVLMGGKFIPQLERLGAIFMPLVVYFFLEFLFLQVLQRSGQHSVKDADYKLLTRVNWVLCFGYLAIADAGFSIVFVMSSMIYWIIQEMTFPRSKPLNLQGRLIVIALPFLTLVLFLWFAPHLLSLIFRQTDWILYGTASVLVFTGVVFFVIQKTSPTLLGFKLPKWGATSLMIILASALVIFNGKISEKVQDKGYALYRAEVLINTPDEIIQKEQFKFNLNRDSKLLRVAQNQWIINYFYQKQHAGLYNYFRILPSFEKGSPYLTQISDLVTVRYVIGEHNQFIITFLLGIMLLLIRASTDADTRFNLFSIVRVRLLCLLFAMGFFIWMAATNRIVFLGQDFPLLSLNSVLTFLTTLGILFFAIVLGDLANQESEQLDSTNQRESLQFTEEGKPLAYNAMQLVTLFVIFGLFYLRQHDFSDERFNLDDTVSRIQTDFERLNSAFLEYQETDEQQRQRNRIKLGQVVREFDNSVFSPRQNKTLFKDSSLALGAYNAYIHLLAQNNSGEHLIHVRRSNDEFYEFAVNKLFFNVSSPDVALNAWQGNIIAQEKNDVFHFTNRVTGRERELNIRQADANLKETLSTLTNSRENNNIRLTNLPAGWSLDSLPVVLLSRARGEQKTNRSTFIVKNGQDIFRSSASDYTLVIKPNDVIQFMPDDGGRVTTLQFQHQSQTYLAKNVWLNGKQQFFYPLGHKFLWSYHFANLVKSKFDTYKVGAPEKRQNVSLTIDPRLTEEVYDLAEGYFRGVSDGGQADARAFNLVVLGSDGGIRALCDYKKGDKVHIDPNRMESYRGILNDLYLNVDTNQERLLFGNRCLLRMDNGPASTFKPILYGAVTSQYNLGWQNLRFGGIPAELQNGFLDPNGTDYKIGRFGGSPVTFTVGKDNIVPHDMDYYISHSTNTYNSMMVFLGSMNRAEIQQEQAYINRTGNPRYLVRGRSGTASLNFPIFDFGGTEYRIGRLPALSLYQNTQSLMGKGLWHNFNFPISTDQLKGREGANIQNIAFDLDSIGFANSRSSNKIWSFPEASHLYMIDRNNLHNAIVQVASGADPINTTPFKMAEMAAGLYSLNRQFKGSVIANHKHHYQTFETDESWGGVDNVAQFHANNLFRAMHNTVQAGTGHNLLNGVTSEFGQYHFYAKTGTISGKRQEGRRDKNLMLIISKEPLHDRNLTVEDMKSNRFFVLYFSFYKQSKEAEWGNVADPLRNMIRAVLRSNSFDHFINEVPES